MSLTIAFSSEAKRDLKRLYRRHPSYADELLDMLHDEVRVQGRVPDAYDPHILDNPRAAYSGALEFHFMDDVLVICYPPTPREFLRILHICTHAELTSACTPNPENHLALLATSALFVPFSLCSICRRTRMGVQPPRTTAGGTMRFPPSDRISDRAR